MSISERQAPDFSHALRGYDRAQVDEYLASYTEYSVQVEERARKAETALAQCRRELASSPGTVGISERLASILQLANEEAEEIRERARTESEATTLAAATEAERTVNDSARAPGRHPTRDRRALRRPRSAAPTAHRARRPDRRSDGALSGIRTRDGAAPAAEVKLFDAEAIDDEPSAAEAEEAAPVAEADADTDADAVVDPEADTQRIATTGPPEHGELVE